MSGKFHFHQLTLTSILVQFICYLWGKCLQSSQHQTRQEPSHGRRVSVPEIRGHIIRVPFYTLTKWFFWPLNYLLNCLAFAGIQYLWVGNVTDISEMWKISPTYFGLNGSRLQSTKHGCSFIQNNKVELSIHIETGLEGYPECSLGKKQDLKRRAKALPLKFEFFITFVCYLYN